MAFELIVLVMYSPIVWDGVLEEYGLLSFYYVTVLVLLPIPRIGRLLGLTCVLCL